MKHIHKKIISFLLLVGMAFGSVGCNLGGESSSLTSSDPVSEESSSSSVMEESSSSSEEEESSSSSSEKPDELPSDWFVNEGETQYTIVHAATLSPKEENALGELKTLLYEGTGIDFPSMTVKEGDFTAFPMNAKYIVLGENALSQLAGVSYDSDTWGVSGVLVERKGDSVFLQGGSYYGTLYAVYEFLDAQLGYDYIGKECLVFDEAACEYSELTDEKIQEKPAIEYRYSMWGPVLKDNGLRLRFRFQSQAEVFMENSKINSVHNALAWVSGAPNPSKFYATSGSQLCYTRNQDELLDVIYTAMTELIDNSPEANLVTLTQQDNMTWCECDECKAVIASHGGVISSTQILFANRLQKKINEYMASEHPDREPVSICIFAYQHTQTAPVKVENGEYVPISEDMIFEENLAVYFAIFGSYEESIYSGAQKHIRDAYEQWGVLTDRCCMWSYGSNFSDYFENVNYINSAAELYKFFEKYGVTYLLMQCDYNNNYAPVWSNLKMYVDSKLMWDPTADVRAIVEKFFTEFYGPAGEIMYEYWDVQNVWERIHGGTGSASDAMMNKYLSYVEAAYEAILPLKYSEPAQYKLLHDRINVESLSPRYYLLNRNGWTWNDDYRKQFVAEFKADLLNRGVTSISEGTTVASWMNNWI